MKKPIVFLLAVLFVLCMFPAASFAADYTLSDGGSMALSSGDTITIEPGASVTLASSSTTLINVRIICGTEFTVSNTGTLIAIGGTGATGIGGDGRNGKRVQ